MNIYLYLYLSIYLLLDMYTYMQMHTASTAASFSCARIARSVSKKNARL